MMPPRADRTMAGADVSDAIKVDLAADPGGVLETVARKHGVSLQTVLDSLAPDEAVRVSGSRFEEVWNELTTWGETTFIVHTLDGVFETRGAIPPGTAGQGYFNVHGDSPIGGHIKTDRCAFIYFVDRPFFTRRSCSVQFVNVDGEAMFKVFVGRDAQRALNAAQVAKFEALRARLARE